jgi:8-oxo-dGTP diphosphatase
MQHQVHVAVGIIRKDDAVFIAKRSKEQHQGGKWEFPGGKIELGETTFSALLRELLEEVGIRIKDARPFCQISFDYADKSVFLDVMEIFDYEGTPYGKEGQETQWLCINQLKENEFPQANRLIIQLLQQGRHEDSKG